jgi:cellobiose phosphorylase
MGCGDWNDGMNLVGKEGKGESVWLGFFLYDVLVKFSDVARLRNDESFAQYCVQDVNYRASRRINIKASFNAQVKAFGGGFYKFSILLRRLFLRFL